MTPKSPVSLLASLVPSPVASPDGRSVSRRHLLAATAAAFALPAVAMPGAAIAADDGELVFEHAYGTAILKSPARRVVSIGYTTQDPLLALGIIPVALRYWFGDAPYATGPWAAPLLGDARPTVIKGEVSAETIAALEPDLIVGIGSGISQEEYALLSQVAPVLMHPKGRAPYDISWDEITTTLGRAVGRSTQAASLVAGTRKAFADIRARHPEWQGKTAAAAYHFGGDSGFFTGTDTRGRVLNELGFVPTAGMTRLTGDAFYVKLSPEDLSALDADLIVWISTSDKVADLAAMPMRKLLKAHVEGREVLAGPLIGAAMSYGSVLSLPYALALLEPDMAAALDGNPATPVASALKAGLAP
ncbi:MAG: ABC transporter substrate-binding protein [Neorhizobium sp.]|nr:ABC transporter substrate-binding protein [Neorhizobium sp.]